MGKHGILRIAWNQRWDTCTVGSLRGVSDESSALRLTKSTAAVGGRAAGATGGTGGLRSSRCTDSHPMPSLSSGGSAHAMLMRPGGPDGLGHAKLRGFSATALRGVDGRVSSLCTLEQTLAYLPGRTALAAASAAAASLRSRLILSIALMSILLSLEWSCGVKPRSFC